MNQSQSQDFFSPPANGSVAGISITVGDITNTVEPLMATS